MSELAAFLLARIADDEAALLDEPRWPYPWLDIETRAARARRHARERRVFIECDAKRRAVESLLDAEAAVERIGPDLDKPGDAAEWANYHAWHEAVELLAQPYADHPDFRDVWRLDAPERNEP